MSYIDGVKQADSLQPEKVLGEESVLSASVNYSWFKP